MSVSFAVTYHSNILFFLPTIAYVYDHDTDVASIQLSFFLFTAFLNIGGRDGV